MATPKQLSPSTAIPYLIYSAVEDGEDTRLHHRKDQVPKRCWKCNWTNSPIQNAIPPPFPVAPFLFKTALGALAQTVFIMW